MQLDEQLAKTPCNPSGPLFSLVAQRLRHRQPDRAQRGEQQAAQAEEHGEPGPASANRAGTCRYSSQPRIAGNCTFTQKMPSANPDAVASKSPSRPITPLRASPEHGEHPAPVARWPQRYENRRG